MQKLLIIIFIFQLFSLQADEKKSEKLTLLFLGDSLTEGHGLSKEEAYPFIIQEKLKDKYNLKVLNGGVSGSTTASGISRLKWFLKADPDILFLTLGANDGLRGVKISESRKNLEKIIKLAKKEELKIVLIGMMLPPNYGKDYTKKFKQMYIDLKEQHKLFWIPFILEGVAGKKELNLDDGIHPNAKGHEVIANNLIKYLEENYDSLTK